MCATGDAYGSWGAGTVTLAIRVPSLGCMSLMQSLHSMKSMLPGLAFEGLRRPALVTSLSMSLIPIANFSSHGSVCVECLSFPFLSGQKPTPPFEKV